MSRFQVREEHRATQNGLNGQFVVLHDLETAARAEVWPALGFNCVRWSATIQDRPVEWLYSSPQLLAETRPTRSGIPILFPFPNRIRGGNYCWEGKSYQLPLNDPTEKNAIHGFACRYPWRIVDQGADAYRAWVQGEFSPLRDAPEVLGFWPASYRIQVTYALVADALFITAVVKNLSEIPLPFGLGYHPYFAVPADPEDTTLQVPAHKVWRLEESLPTGVQDDVDERTNLRMDRSFAELRLDDILTGIDNQPLLRTPDLLWRGSIRRPRSGAQLDLHTDPAFRELVAFTPPHRQAVCLEPYTCTTDAINLQQRGVDAGWLTLAPGADWSATVALISSATRED